MVLDLVPEVRHDSGHILESARSRCTVASEIPLKSKGLGCAEGPLPPEPNYPKFGVSPELSGHHSALLHPGIPTHLPPFRCSG